MKLLKQILKENNKQKYLFSCIKDLTLNGINLDRFAEEDKKPTRQDVTQYIAKWFKYVGASSNQCSEWLIDYSINCLSKISSSSYSKIRHSTKSNIKYIYDSENPFECGCENNLFKISCIINCPIYETMSAKYQQMKIAEGKQSYYKKPQEDVDVVSIEKNLLRDTYKDQFQKALKTAKNHSEDGLAIYKIVDLLNGKNFKTRMGKKWTRSTLGNELRRLASEGDNANVK